MNTQKELLFILVCGLLLSGCGLGSGNKSKYIDNDAIPINRLPYLQSVSDHTATIMWQTEIPGKTTLFIQSEDGSQQRIYEIDKPGHDFSIQLEDLLPSCRYHYRLSGPFEYEGSFETRCIGAEDDKASLIVLGDPGTILLPGVMNGILQEGSVFDSDIGGGAIYVTSKVQDEFVLMPWHLKITNQ